MCPNLGPSVETGFPILIQGRAAQEGIFGCVPEGVKGETTPSFERVGGHLLRRRLQWFSGFMGRVALYGGTPLLVPLQ